MRRDPINNRLTYLRGYLIVTSVSVGEFAAIYGLALVNAWPEHGRTMTIDGGGVAKEGKGSISCFSSWDRGVTSTNRAILDKEA